MDAADGRLPWMGEVLQHVQSVAAPTFRTLQHMRLLYGETPVSLYPYRKVLVLLTPLMEVSKPFSAVGLSPFLLVLSEMTL